MAAAAVETPATSTSGSPEPIKQASSYVFQNEVDKIAPHVIKGDGIRLTIEDPTTGETSVLIDAMTGAAVGALGWGDEEVIKYINEAAQDCHYSYQVYLGNKNAQNLSKFYIDNSYPGAFAAGLWVGSGSEANENAMKLMHQYFLEKNMPKKTKFISRAISYHGFSIATLSIGGNPRQRAMKNMLMTEDQCLKTDVCFPFRFKPKDQSMDDYVQALADNLEKLILKEGPETIAGLIIETLPGSSIGTAPPPPGYLPALRKICNKYDILFHLDEVMCGTGRCNPNGKLNCWENYLQPGEGPDIQTVGKTLGSGYVTIAGILISPKMKETFLQGSGFVNGAHTYAGHSFNCYVALKIQERIKEMGLTKNIFEMGNYLGKKFQTELLPNNQMTVDVRGIGGFWSIEFAKSKESLECFDPKINVASRIQKKCIANGLTVMAGNGCAGLVGDHIMFAPSYIVTKDDIDEIVARASKSINEVTEELIAEGVL